MHSGIQPPNGTQTTKQGLVPYLIKQCYEQFFLSAQVDQLDNIRYMYANVKVKMSEYFFPDYLTIQNETIQIQVFFLFLYSCIFMADFNAFSPVREANITKTAIIFIYM